jgi:hypothetical protein
VRLHAKRIVDLYRSGSSRPIVAETEGGRFVVKFAGAPEGPRALAAEWLCTGLASAIGLPALELVPVEVEPSLGGSIADSEIREAIERGAGTGLGFRELPGAAPARPSDLQAAGAELSVPLLWLDLLVHNPDRRVENPNILKWGPSLIPIDYGASLGFHHGWTVSEQMPALELEVPQRHVFADRAPLLAAWHARLRARLPRNVLEGICGSLPSEWLEPAAFADAARERAAYVAYLWKRLAAMDTVMAMG